MMNVQASTLRPGLLVSLKTSVSGNVSYRRQDLEPVTVENGQSRAKWETEKTVADVREHEEAIKVQSKASSLIRGICARSAFGLLCPEDKAQALDSAVAEARKLTDSFNASAALTRVSVYVIAGRVESNDLEAVKAINSEVRDLLSEMQAGVQSFDVERIRDAANKAKQLGAMLSPQAQQRIQTAIDAARVTARAYVKAGETAAIEIDRATLERIAGARTMFLDLDDSREITESAPIARAVDLEPATYAGNVIDSQTGEIAANIPPVPYTPQSFEVIDLKNAPTMEIVKISGVDAPDLERKSRVTIPQFELD